MRRGEKRNNRINSRSRSSAALAFAVLTVNNTALAAQQGTESGEWRHYGGDIGATGYSPPDQIDRDNVQNLEIAWRWQARNFGPLFRAHDKMTGEILAEIDLPASQNGVPMTYMHDGDQYVVVSVAGRGNAGELVALRLPL